MMKRRLSVYLFLSLLLLLVACGSPAGEQLSEDPAELEPAVTTPPTIQPTWTQTEEVATPTRLAMATPTETPTETPTRIATAEPTQPPTATATIVPDPPAQVPRNIKTGLPEVDFVIDTVLSNDLEARQALVQFVTASCTRADGLGATPTCESGQAEGTLVDFFPLGGPGEGHSVPASEVGRVLEFEAESLYAAYVVSEDLPDRPEFPHGTYALFFTTVPSGESNNVSVILRVDDEGYIVRLDGVGIPLDFYFQQKAADLIEPPPETVIFASEAAEILVYPPETDQ
ncbi:MAG: hypothetical protein WA996_19860 [Candidatus Promineifilaceae bacterium]